MRQVDSQAINFYARCRPTDVALETTAANGTAVLNSLALYLLVCAFWGVILFVALTAALH